MEGNAEFMALPEGGGRERKWGNNEGDNTVSVSLQMTIHWKGQERENTQSMRENDAGKIWREERGKSVVGTRFF